MLALKFSSHYIFNLIKRFRLRRRRNTRENKLIPAVEKVVAHMQRQQQFIAGLAPLYAEDMKVIYDRMDGGFTAIQVANFDESGICPLSPLHQYTPQDTTSLRNISLLSRFYIEFEDQR